MKTKLFDLLCLLCLISINAFSQSTSPNFNSLREDTTAFQPVALGSVITFSEYPRGTVITNQYQSIGIIFTLPAFITSDGANPTSPVLSGTPLFSGPIAAKFVKPGTNTPTVVKSFKLDAGYFDNFGSTKIEWFDPKGKVLGQRINSKLGIETITIEGGNIASWQMSVVANEPAGFAVDNISFEPIGPSVLFREKIESEKEGTWGIYPFDDIPGFDHVGFHIANRVYESHPGYITGNYLSKDGNESVLINQFDGVQDQFTRATFEHDSKVLTTSVVDFDEIPISENLANQMETKIKTRLNNATFGYINFHSLDGINQTLSPDVQKGKNNTFTCVGLVEWAAEQSGHNAGEGFIPNKFEIIDTRPYIDFTFPTLSPQLLNYAMKGQDLVNKSKQWLQGFIDGVRFVIIDPLGRKLGYSPGSPRALSEIPNSFYPGSGTTEQFLIPTAVPGKYTIQIIGKGKSAIAAFGALGSSEAYQSPLLVEGQIVEKIISVPPTVGCMGDVNRDGTINEADVTLLISKLNRFTDGLGDPGDLDGDGLYTNNDVTLLRQLIQALGCSVVDLTLTAPANGTTAVTNVTLTASAAIQNGNITQVNFYQNVGKTKTGIIARNLLGSDNTAPYSLDLKNMIGGNYVFQAEAVNTCSVSSFSNTSTVNVLETFTVLITSPTTGQGFVSGSNVNLQASVTAYTSRTVTKVEFYANDIKLGEDFTAPYTFLWTNVPAGNKTIVAKAIDNTGGIWSSPFYFFGINSANQGRVNNGNANAHNILLLNTTPNPASDVVVLHSNVNEDGDYSLTISDIVGKMIVSKQMTYLKGVNTETVDISSFSKGIYIIRLTNMENKEFVIQKLIID